MYVSIPFRSGRRSHSCGATTPQSTPPSVNPLQIGAPFTRGSDRRDRDRRVVSIPFRSGRRSHVIALHVHAADTMCQSPSDRGAVHTRGGVDGARLVDMCQSPSDRGAVHTGLCTFRQKPALTVSIPFRSGRRSHVAFGVPASYWPRCQSPSDRGAVHTCTIPSTSVRLTRVNPLQIGAPFTQRDREAHRRADHVCQSPSDRGAVHTSWIRRFSLFLTKCVNPLQIGAPFTRGYYALLTPVGLVSIPFRSGRRSHSGSGGPAARATSPCQSPSDRGAVHTATHLSGL